MQVKGSVAVIIGAAQGIGKAIVDKLLRLGAQVAFGDNEEDTGVVTLKEFQAKYGEDHVLFQKCDITQKKDIQGLLQAAVSRWGHIDIFSPVAGIHHETNWELCLQVNLVGGIQGVQEVMKYMSKEEGGTGGVIVILSSVLAYTVFPFTPVYRATKGALLCYAQAMAADASYAHHGIRFNILCPGAIETRLQDMFQNDQNDRWLYSDEARQFASDHFAAEFAPPSAVAAGFVRFVEDETMRGQALLIEREGGKDLIKTLTFNVTSEVLETIKAP